MKIQICDICYRTKEIYEVATTRIGFTNGLKIDVCPKHKKVFDKFDNVKDATLWFYNLESSK